MNSNMNCIKQLMIITFLISFLCVVGSQQQSIMSEDHGFLWNFVYNSFVDSKEKSLLAGEYNKNHKLLTLPREMQESIVMESIVTQKSLEDSLKTTLSLSCVCKNFNAIVVPNKIGKACKHYEQEEKDKVMKKLLWSMNDFNYQNKRHAAMMLIYAGADNQACKYCSLLWQAIYRNDKDMITILFANSVSPNQISYYGNPDFFAIKNVDIAKMFVAQEVDINAGNNNYPNVLWYFLVHHPFSELIEFYLQNKVDATKIETSTGDCLLHQFVKCAWLDRKSIEDYIKIGELLYTAAPEMINSTNRDKETPLDVTQRRLKKITFIGYSQLKTLEALIPFFEKHGGKTAQQLKAAQLK